MDLPRLRHQADWSQQAGRYGLDLVHILRLKALAVTQVEETVIRQPPAGHIVQRQIGHDDSNPVVTRTQKSADVQRVRGTPKRSCAPVVDINNGRFMDGRVEPYLHTG